LADRKALLLESFVNVTLRETCRLCIGVRGIMRGLGATCDAFGFVVVVVGFSAVAAGQSLRIDEPASKVTLSGKTYAVVLTATSTQNRQSVVIKLKVIAPNGAQLAESSVPVQLKIGRSKLSASVSLPELPQNSDDLLWYRLAYRLTADETELANGILPLFESVEKSVPRGRGWNWFSRIRQQPPLGIANEIQLLTWIDEG
jgi:hypothetical protein